MDKVAFRGGRGRRGGGSTGSLCEGGHSIKIFVLKKTTEGAIWGRGHLKTIFHYIYQAPGIHLSLLASRWTWTQDIKDVLDVKVHEEEKLERNREYFVLVVLGAHSSKGFVLLQSEKIN